MKLLGITQMVIFVCLAMGLVSCDTKSPVEKYTEEKVLVLGNSNEPNGLDPQIVTGVIESNILRALFEGLCSDHPEKQGVHLPGAAAHWEASEDFRVWTFYLQPKGKWSDGKPVTTEDFVFAYHRILHPKFGAKYASMLYFMEGAEDYNKTALGKILCGNDDKFPVSWEILQQVNFQGDSKIDTKAIKGKEFTQLSDEEKDLYISSKGLDKVAVAVLEYIKSNLSLVEWPDEVSDEVKQLVLDRLIAYQKAPYDLWDKAKVGVKAVDSHTLQVKLNAPVPFLPDLTKHFTWYPVPKHAILAHKPMEEKHNPWTNAENIISNGPFKLQTWKFNDKIEAIRNPHYWDAKEVKLNAIRFIPVVNVHTEARMFFANQLHATYTLAPSLIEYAEEKFPESFKKETYLGTSFIRFNMTNEKLKDVKVRRALSLSVERQLIIDKILKGGQQPATGMVPPMGEYKASDVVKLDIKKAQQLLQEAGYSKSNPLKLELLTTDKESNKRQAEAYQDMWRKNLGVEISIKQYEWKTYLSKLSNLEYDIAMGGWIGDYPDPTTFLDMWKDGDGNNRAGWSNREYETLLKEASLTADPSERIKLLQEAESILLDDPPFTPIYWLTNVYLLHPSVKNWHPLLLKNQPYKFIDLK